MKNARFIFGAVAALAAAVAPQLSAEPVCSNADLNGNYAMWAPGIILAAPGFPASFIGPFARVGQVFADGRGNVSIANTASYNGNIITEAYAGTYTVSADCSLDIQPIVGLPLGPGGSLVPVPFDFQGALADTGNSAALVLCGLGAPCFAAPTGNVIRVILKRNSVYSLACYNYSLSGAFELDLSGTVITGAAAGPFARDGLLAFDGSGNFRAKTVVNYTGGVITPESFTGTYKVDSLCNATLTYTASGGTHVWTGTISNNGNNAYLIVNDAGTVISGTLTKQQPGVEWVY